jgi:hypothetical protein
MKTKAKSRKVQDYKSLFIKESGETARTGKTVYLRREHHERIMKIAQVIGDNNLSIFSYIDNVLIHHFEHFQDEINELYRQKNSNSIF